MTRGVLFLFFGCHDFQTICCSILGQLTQHNPLKRYGNKFGSQTYQGADPAAGGYARTQVGEWSTDLNRGSQAEKLWPFGPRPEPPFDPVPMKINNQVAGNLNTGGVNEQVIPAE